MFGKIQLDRSLLSIAAIFFLAASTASAQSITYQGELNQNGSPANGSFDFTFRLYNGPNILASPIGDAIPVNNVSVVNGRFTVELNFPISSFDNSDRWLRITVNGTGLTPFQKINRTPYAIQTRGILVDALQNVSIGTGGFPAFTFGELRVQQSAPQIFALDLESSDSQFPTIFAVNDGPGPVLWADGVSDASVAGGGVIVVGNEAGPNIAIDRNEIMARSNGQTSTLFLNHNGGNVLVGASSGGTAMLSTPVLQITGGSDFSEMFEVGGSSEIEPGMVVVIDPENPGKLLPSKTANDRRVAGIVSGAGGVATGLTMGHDGTIADGKHPIALSGRVYCLVDASDAAIEPGDMLTTSTTPGHAMKASDPDSAAGAIIGKAMTPLATGETGLVLVLVNLQ